MLTVEDIRKKADSPFTKGYQELERLYQTLPELFSKNAFAPIFKSSEKLSNAEPGDAVQQEPGKKPRGQQYIEMRMDDYTETLAKGQGKHHPDGGLRSTLENHFMDEGIRAQAAPAKPKQPQPADFPVNHKMGPKQEPMFNNLEPEEVMYGPQHAMQKQQHDFYMQQQGVFPENYEEVYDPYTGELVDPYHQMYQYGHPMHAMGAYTPEGQFMQGYPPYYYPPHAGEPMMGHGYVPPAGPAGPAPQQKPKKQPAQGAAAANRSEDNEEKPNSKEGGMEHANFIKNAGVIDDMEMDAGPQYYLQDPAQGYPPHEYHNPYNYGYMNYVNQPEGEEDVQGDGHMMHQQYGYYGGKEHDPHYGNVYMGYEDPYLGYGMQGQHMGYDPQQYMHPEYGMPYAQQGYQPGYYGEQVEEHPMQYDSRTNKQQAKNKKIPNAKDGGSSQNIKPQSSQKKVQEKSQKGPVGPNQGKVPKKSQQGVGLQPGGINPNDIKQYQQPQYRQPVNTHQMGHSSQINPMRPQTGSKVNGDQMAGQQGNRGKQGQQKSNSNLPNMDTPGQQSKKPGQKTMEGNQRKSNANAMGMPPSPGQQMNPMMQGNMGGSFNNIQSPQMNMGQQPMSGELGTPNQKKRKLPQQPPQSGEHELLDDYYEEGGNGQGPNSSQKSGNRARQVFFVKK